MDLKVKRSTVFTVGFGMLRLRTFEEEEHADEDYDAVVFEAIDADVGAHFHRVLHAQNNLNLDQHIVCF